MDLLAREGEEFLLFKLPSERYQEVRLDRIQSFVSRQLEQGVMLSCVSVYFTVQRFSVEEILLVS